jgi:tetratricopeptide (TPR) repeat protein
MHTLRRRLQGPAVSRARFAMRFLVAAFIVMPSMSLMLDHGLALAQSNAEQTKKQEARINALEREFSTLDGRIKKLESLENRVKRLESFEQRWIGYGSVDEHRISQAWFRCESESVSVESSRPGVFRFHFLTKLARKPVIVATPANRWGDVRIIEISNLRVADVDETGFTVETFRSLDLSDVAFTFLVVRGSGGSKIADRVRDFDCPGTVDPRPRNALIAAKVVTADPTIRSLDEAIAKDPNDAAALSKRGQLLALKRIFPAAIQDLDEVLLRMPRDPEALNNRCWARAVLGDLQTALRDCDEALHLRPRYADALDSHGFINLKMGRPNDAIVDYDAALQINPRQASSLYGRGIARLRSGNSADGVRDMAAAKALQANIADEFAAYGIR